VAWLRFKGNVNRSFRNPSFQELYLPDRGFISGNPDLDPERATHYDLGFELLLDSIYGVRDIRLAASVFRSEIENSIIWVHVSPFKVRPRNSNDATTQGVEMSASIGLGPYVTLSANHTELRAKVEPNGVRLPGRANRETHARLEVGRPGLLKAIGEMQRTGSISVSESGTYTLPSRISWNASLAFELSHLSGRLGLELGLRRLWVHAAVENIGDIAIRDSLSFPQPGRSLRMGLEAQW
jgi:outer membrane receptor protein involved in Fe transport